jgi:hypothetical protein
MEEIKIKKQPKNKYIKKNPDDMKVLRKRLALENHSNFIERLNIINAKIELAENNKELNVQNLSDLLEEKNKSLTILRDICRKLIKTQSLDSVDQIVSSE